MILLIFTLLCFITGHVSLFSVTVYSGGTVIIYCHYDKKHINNNKYFCMRQSRFSCKDNIRTGIKNSWYHSGRFSLYDDTEGNYFIVVIRKLTRQDEDTYWCGVDTLLLDSYTKVDLEVKEDECCEKLFTETAYLEGKDSIICNYPEDYQNGTKYLIKKDGYPIIYN
ncbi:hypothetical protein UPYG_G00059110, partial [Umbra pygmaea]